MAKSNSHVIIADTSGLVSLFSPTDHNHGMAITAAKTLRTEQKDILIPLAVFYEFANILGKKLGHPGCPLRDRRVDTTLSPVT